MQGETFGLILERITPKISIHSPYAGGDNNLFRQAIYDLLFQSTPPMQGETILVDF